jgi:hypothetical protein
VKPFTSFPLLDTIEIDTLEFDNSYSIEHNLPLSEFAASEIKEASKILKENKSQADKMVIVTKWNDVTDLTDPYKDVFDVDEGYMIRETIKM